MNWGLNGSDSRVQVKSNLSSPTYMLVKRGLSVLQWIIFCQPQNFISRKIASAAKMYQSQNSHFFVIVCGLVNIKPFPLKYVRFLSKSVRHNMWNLVGQEEPVVQGSQRFQILSSPNIQGNCKTLKLRLVHGCTDHNMILVKSRLISQYNFLKMEYSMMMHVAAASICSSTLVNVSPRIDSGKVVNIFVAPLLQKRFV